METKLDEVFAVLSGIVVIPHWLPIELCQVCSGTGRRPASQEDCRFCNGTGAR